jgi:hypothetical protein
VNVAVAVRFRTWSIERVCFATGAVAAGALAAAACLPGALQFALWQDEVASARAIAEPQPLALLRHVARTESTPPLWYALAWVAHRFGVAIVDVRLLSVAAAALLASATAVAARRVVPRPAALLAGTAVALGYQFDFHGRELRAYELAALLVVALAVAASRGGTVLAAVVAAGSLTHYFFLFSVLAVLLWRPRLWRPIFAGLVPLALWSPLLLRQYAQHRFSFIGAFDLRAVATTYWLTFVRAQPHTAVVHTLAPLLLLAGVLVGALVLARGSNEGRLWALLAVVPVAAAALMWTAGLRVYDIRNLIVTGPFAAAAVVCLLAHLPRRTAAAGACALLMLVGTGYMRGNRTTPVPYDRIAAALVAEGWRQGAPIGVYGNVDALWGPLEWYLPQHPRLVPGGEGRHPVFVVAARGPSWRAVVRRAVAVRYVRQTLVARLGGPTVLPGARTLVGMRAP